MVVPTYCDTPVPPIQSPEGVGPVSVAKLSSKALALPIIVKSVKTTSRPRPAGPLGLAPTYSDNDWLLGSVRLPPSEKARTALELSVKPGELAPLGAMMKPLLGLVNWSVQVPPKLPLTLANVPFVPVSGPKTFVF